MKYYAYLLACVFALTASNAFAGALVPNTFTNGETISSSKMNANFTSLEAAVNTAMATVTLTVRSTGVSENTASSIGSSTVSQTCNVGEILTGGSCSSFHADFDSSTTNFGVVWTCDIIGNTIMGMSLASGISYDNTKYGSPMTVNAVCASMTTITDTIPAVAASIRTLTGGQQEEPKAQELDQEALNALQRMEQQMRELEQSIK